jgi:hypothetical protein
MAESTAEPPIAAARAAHRVPASSAPQARTGASGTVTKRSHRTWPGPAQQQPLNPQHGKEMK